MSNLVKAYLDDYGQINVIIRKKFCNGITDKVYLLDGNSEKELTITAREERQDEVYYEVSYDEDLTIGREYQVMVTNAFRVPLVYRKIVKTPRFNEEFYYPGNDLGCSLAENITRFALWAPTASAVKIEIDYQGNVKTLDMRRTENGVYRLTTSPQIIGARYRYIIMVNGTVHCCGDPYAKCSEANNGRSIVVDLAKFKTEKIHVPDYWRYNQAIIYEASIRDFTERGTFRSFLNEADYLEALGITHVQLMPVFDFGSVDELHPSLYYNWGYDPIQHQCLEGSYSENVMDPQEGMAEFRDLVYGLHSHGIRVNLDVVFNHVYRMDESTFEQTVPYYFFRYNPDGTVSDGSGCGNDFASEMSMARKYILDTLVYYVEQFDVDGFRFDLMGLLDIETMNQVCATLKQIKEEVMIYGEGWSMKTALPEKSCATSANRALLPQVAFFNDAFRETIKGSTFDAYKTGYGTGNITMVEQAMEAVRGLLFDQPVQSVNYVECHDDMTCFDKLNICCQSEPIADLVRRQKLLLGMVILSQGIPFIHSGQEYCRSKRGITNSYNKGDDINKVRHEDRIRYEDVVDYVRDLIEIRKKYHLSKNREGIMEDVRVENMNGCILYKINNCAGNNNLTVIINPGERPVNYSFVGYRKVIFGGNGVVEDRIEAAPLSITILGSNLDD